MEHANHDKKSSVEEQLQDQASLEESKPSADSLGGGTSAEERRGALRNQ